MANRQLTLDFFHDVVCGWCFNLSPRLQVLRDEFNLKVHHRTFVLQDRPAEMRARFGSMENAKSTILGHWRACQAASDQPDAFNIAGMQQAAFDYPHGMPGALACKAVELMTDQDGHWRMFDAIQEAHIRDARNVADLSVLTDIAVAQGLSSPAFVKEYASSITRTMVEEDRTLARRLQVSSVPTVIVRNTGTRLVNGPLEDLRAQLDACQRLSA